MALTSTPESSGGVFNAVKNALGLFNDTNKANGLDENTNPTPADIYESSLDEAEIKRLTSQWKRDYSVYYDAVEKGQKLSFDYWVGKHRNQDPTNVTGKETGVTDNLIFEAIETFLPIATRANPEPLVSADPSPEGQALANDIKIVLAHEADVQQLKRKLAKTTRGWLLNRVGVVKVTWNPIIKKIETTVINGKRLIFDKDGYINERCQFVGEYIGEKKRASAENLIQMFPKKKSVITAKAHGKMGTMLEYFEWWYRAKDTFFTLEDLVLGKYKNPNWNYDIQAQEGKEAVIDPETGVEVYPAQAEQQEVEATNHLDEPSYPYRFLAIFSTGEQPHDNTSLILQNIPQQDKINRREIQIEDNVKGMNNGMVVSGSAFTEDQASQAASALRRGVAIRVPNGDVGKAVMFPTKPALPSDVFHSLQDARAELRNIFGTAGSSAEGIKSQETVRGKIMVNQADSSRIGGGITEYIEQLADAIYNLWVQMMLVHFEEEQFITSAGTINGPELIMIKNSRFIGIKNLTITVKEGSLVPKDPLTQRNEAIDLWSANAIDPRTLFKKLDFPDPDEATKQLILWQMLQKGQIQPQMYLPSFIAGQTQGLPTEQPGTGGPAVSAVGPSQPGDIPPQNPEGPQQPSLPSPQLQSQQLMQSQPLPKV